MPSDDTAIAPSSPPARQSAVFSEVSWLLKTMIVPPVPNSLRLVSGQTGMAVPSACRLDAASIDTVRAVASDGSVPQRVTK